MKRFLLIVLVLLVAFSAVAYVFIPSQFTLRQKVSVQATERGIARFLLLPANWKNWWPAENNQSYNGYSFSPGNVTLSGLTMRISNDAQVINSQIVYSITGEKEAEITWLAVIKTSSNPFGRVRDFIRAQSLNPAMSDILLALKNFLNDDKKVYGISFKVEKVRDTLVLTNQQMLPAYPDTKEIYARIGALRKKIMQNKLSVLDSPMLNVIKNDDKFRVTTAIAVNRRIANSDGFYMSSLVPGNALSTSVRGGNYTVKKALATMKDYMDDHRLISPAMPFQQLVTNRQLEKDTSKWVTRLYYPIF